MTLQEKWESRILRAKKEKEDWEKRFRVQMGRDYFEGQQNPGWPENEWITVNKTYSHMKAQLPALYNLDPFFYVKTKRSFNPDPMQIVLFDLKGKKRQSYLNYLKVELGLKTTARLAIQDAHFAFGVLKTHYSSDERENPDAGKPIMGDGESVLVGDDGSPLMEPDTLPANEKYNWTRVHPDDFLFDEDAGPLQNKWSWVAERCLVTPDEAKKDPRLSRSVVNSAPTKSRKTESQESSGFFRGLFARKPSGQIGDGDADNEILVTWEIYDLKKKQWLIVIEGADKPAMMPADLPPGVEDHPYGLLRFTLRDKSPYPIPPVSQTIDPQKEYSTSRSMVLRHRKRFNRKYEAAVNLLMDPDEDLSKLESGGDGTVIQVQQIGAVQPIQDAPLDQSTYQELALLNNDLIELWGTSDESRGLAGADSATQAALIDKRLEIREGDHLSLVVDFVKDAARKMDQLVQVHMTRDEAVKITGPDGDEIWDLIRPSDFDDIDGEYEYTVNVGSTIPKLPQVERAQFLAFLQILQGFPHIMTQKRLLKRILEMHHIEDESLVEELFKLGKQILGGEVPMPGGSGSQAGVPQDNPITKLIGAAMGDRGGNANGGGAPE